MPVTIKVNGTSNSLVHKGSNGISTATIPDVCKTPTPGGPVPIPYPNISQSTTLSKGTTTVKADGGMMVAIKGSEFSMSNGDEAGTVGGVKSSTFIKESTWILYSFDVKMEGQGACRLTDKKFQNHENTADLAGTIQDPKTVVELETMLCEIWKKCEEKINNKYKGKNKDGKWCWERKPGKPPNAFKISNEKHSCCKEEIEKNQKGAKNDILPATSADSTSFPVPGTDKSIRPDVVYGSPPKKVYDFKFQCPKRSTPPKWPLYSSKVKGARTPPGEQYDGMTQDQIYKKACGKSPKMINEHSDTCSE
ncbi:DUF4150 domain-containing protein [Chitinivorax sp. PXF-14]|uniref:DUF4150 domain-containing protein n=1 Tax=Chitinivorax sp. PXF-14 TaxID=3230488 RepID=UPI00346685BC